MSPPKKPPTIDEKKTIFDVIDYVAERGYGSEAVKVEKNGKPILSRDALAFEKEKYYRDVPKMSLKTLRREPDPRRIPYMTIEQLRTLSDELYLTKDKKELPYLFDDLNENGDFPEGLLNDPVSTRVKENWEKGRYPYEPTNLFYHVIPIIVAYTYEFDQEQITDFHSNWIPNNERKFFENVYRVLIKPEINNPYPGGKRRTTKKRKNKKSKQKSSKRRRL